MREERVKRSNQKAFNFADKLAGLLARVIFHREMIRNELKDVSGSFVLLCNHECALDAVLLSGVFRQSPAFVISDQFYYTVPVKGLLKKLNLIHKLQFQTNISDIRKMRAAVKPDADGLVLFPAGLMSEDGLPTPMPRSTEKFIRILGADVYIARITGSYFVQPKWSAKRHPGKTMVDVYQLFSSEELKNTPIDEVEDRIGQALDFDAYREQEKLRIRYKNADHIEGLENVLYRCPHCGKSYTIKVRDHHTIFCEACGYTEKADEYGFLHLVGDCGKEIRYVSDWSRQIYQSFKNEVEADPEFLLETFAAIQILNREAGRFDVIGQGKVTLNRKGFIIEGTLNDEECRLKIGIAGMPTLPFKPGHCFDIQTGDDIYRCYPENGQMCVQFTHLTEILYEL